MQVSEKILWLGLLLAENITEQLVIFGKHVDKDMIPFGEKTKRMSRVRKQKSYLVLMLKHLVKFCSSWLVKGLEMRGTNTCFVKVKFNMQDSESWTFKPWKLRKVECSVHLLYSLLLLPWNTMRGAILHYSVWWNLFWFHDIKKGIPCRFPIEGYGYQLCSSKCSFFLQRLFNPFSQHEKICVSKHICLCPFIWKLKSQDCRFLYHRRTWGNCLVSFPSKYFISNSTLLRGGKVLTVISNFSFF